MSIYDKLQALDITLPPVAVPAAAYVPFVQTGNLVFLSGHIAKKDGQVWTGQLGANITTAEGQQAARAVAIDLLGTLQAACGGDLNHVQRIVKVDPALKRIEQRTTRKRTDSNAAPAGAGEEV